jgi:hypothetical protein
MNLVKKPVLRITEPFTTYEIWVLNPGQTCRITSASCHEFTAKKTASLIYVTKGVSGIIASEQDLDDPGTWAWIRRFMQLGMDMRRAFHNIENAA